MTTSYSSAQMTKITMTNYQYPNLYSFWSLLIVLVLLIPCPILAIAQQSQYESTSTSILRSTTTTTISTVLYNDGIVYDGDNENSEGEGDIYDDQEDSHDTSPPTIISQPKLHNNITSHVTEETQINEYDDEASSYHDDEDELENQIYGNTMSVNRPDSRHPPVDPNNKKPFVTQSTSRIPFLSANIWRDLFSKPAILVGVVGGIVMGMLSAILLIMFIIYRMRKKDEGSYALEEGPRKSPSHAYTRVSSREFFA